MPADWRAFLAMLWPLRMRSSPLPFPCKKPDFVEEEPERYPGYDGVRNVQSRIPFAEGIKAEPISRVDMWQPFVIWMQLELRVEHMYIRTPRQGVVDFDRVHIAEFSGLKRAAPDRSLPRPALDLELRISSEQPETLQCKADYRTRKISIARHGTCSPEYALSRHLR